MLPNQSPWIAELRDERAVSMFAGDTETDVVIVGGGIAGVSTAYFLLKYTNKRVVLLEADLIAHGASGHNAGQVTSQFERRLAELENEFGADLCATTLKDLERGWELFEAMRVDAAPTVPAPQFKGAVGVSTKQQAQEELEDIAIYRRLGLEVASLVASDDWAEGQELAAAFPGHVEFASPTEIQVHLETIDPMYHAYVPFRRVVANSALLATRVAETLLAREPARFSVYENSRVSTIVLGDAQAEVHVKNERIRAKRVVLCTNGFAGFDVVNTVGTDVHPRDQYPVEGVIGYMAGYYERAGHPPMAISYFDAAWSKMEDPYYYVTRRPYASPYGHRDLICIGGPHAHHGGPGPYTRYLDCPDSVRTSVDAFMKRTYGQGTGAPEFAFCWHGLMGYTQNGVRLVGAEPRNSVLMYNLGCNGIGLLPSVYGAERIARLVNGEDLAPTFFDPQDKRCVLPPKTIPS